MRHVHDTECELARIERESQEAARALLVIVLVLDVLLYMAFEVWMAL